jgi:hypothetical protein
MPDLPHSTDMALAAMWRRIYRIIQEIVDQQITARFGQSWRGGALSGSAVSGPIPLASLPAHHTTHETGGSDALTGTLDANARVAVAKNGAAPTGTRRTLNLIEGTNVTLTVADNSVSERVDVTIAALGGSGNVTKTGAGGSEPGSPATGDLYFPTGSFYVERYSGSAWVPWGPIYAFTKPPVLSNWTWVNQNSATATDESGGGIFLKVANSATEINYLLKKAAPSTPYTITAALLPLMGPAGGSGSGECGLLFRQSSNGNLVCFRLNQEGGTPPVLKLSVTKSSSTGAGVAHYVDADASMIPRQPLWLRIADDGTNRICSVSADGVNWLQWHSVGRTDYITADEVGFFVGGNNSQTVQLTLLSWAVT